MSRETCMLWHVIDCFTRSILNLSVNSKLPALKILNVGEVNSSKASVFEVALADPAYVSSFLVSSHYCPSFIIFLFPNKFKQLKIIVIITRPLCLCYRTLWLSKRDANFRLQWIFICRITPRLLAEYILHEWGSFPRTIICM